MSGRPSETYLNSGRTAPERPGVASVLASKDHGVIVLRRTYATKTKLLFEDGHVEELYHSDVPRDKSASPPPARQAGRHNTALTSSSPSTAAPLIPSSGRVPDAAHTFAPLSRSTHAAAAATMATAASPSMSSFKARPTDSSPSTLGTAPHATPTAPQSTTAGVDSPVTMVSVSDGPRTAAVPSMLLPPATALAGGASARLPRVGRHSIVRVQSLASDDLRVTAAAAATATAGAEGTSAAADTDHLDAVYLTEVTDLASPSPVGRGRVTGAPVTHALARLASWRITRADGTVTNAAAAATATAAPTDRDDLDNKYVSQRLDALREQRESKRAVAQRILKPHAPSMLSIELPYVTEDGHLLTPAVVDGEAPAAKEVTACGVGLSPHLAATARRVLVPLTTYPDGATPVQIYDRIVWRERGAMQTRLSGLDVSRFMHTVSEAGTVALLYFWFVVLRSRRSFVEHLLEGRYKLLLAAYRELFPRRQTSRLPAPEKLEGMVDELLLSGEQWRIEGGEEHVAELGHDVRTAASASSSATTATTYDSERPRRQPRHRRLDAFYRENGYALLTEQPELLRAGVPPPQDVVWRLIAALDAFVTARDEFADVQSREERCFHGLAVEFGHLFLALKYQKDFILESYEHIVAHVTHYALLFNFINDAHGHVFNEDFRVDLFRLFHYWCSGLLVTHVPTHNWPVPLSSDVAAAFEAEQEELAVKEAALWEAIAERADAQEEEEKDGDGAANVPPSSSLSSSSSNHSSRGRRQLPPMLTMDSEDAPLANAGRRGVESADAYTPASSCRSWSSPQFVHQTPHSLDDASHPLAGASSIPARREHRRVAQQRRTHEDAVTAPTAVTTTGSTASGSPSASCATSQAALPTVLTILADTPPQPFPDPHADADATVKSHNRSSSGPAAGSRLDAVVWRPQGAPGAATASRRQSTRSTRSAKRVRHRKVTALQPLPGEEDFDELDVEVANGEYRLISKFERYAQHANQLMDELEKRVQRQHQRQVRKNLLVGKAVTHTRQQTQDGGARSVPTHTSPNSVARTTGASGMHDAVSSPVNRTSDDRGQATSANSPLLTRWAFSVPEQLLRPASAGSNISACVSSASVASSGGGGADGAGDSLGVVKPQRLSQRRARRSRQKSSPGARGAGKEAGPDRAITGGASADAAAVPVAAMAITSTATTREEVEMQNRVELARSRFQLSGLASSSTTGTAATRDGVRHSTAMDKLNAMSVASSQASGGAVSSAAAAKITAVTSASLGDPTATSLLTAYPLAVCEAEVRAYLIDQARLRYTGVPFPLTTSSASAAAVLAEQLRERGAVSAQTGDNNNTGGGGDAASAAARSRESHREHNNNNNNNNNNNTSFIKQSYTSSGAVMRRNASFRSGALLGSVYHPVSAAVSAATVAPDGANLLDMSHTSVVSLVGAPTPRAGSATMRGSITSSVGPWMQSAASLANSLATTTASVNMAYTPTAAAAAHGQRAGSAKNGQTSIAVHELPRTFVYYVEQQQQQQHQQPPHPGSAVGAGVGGGDGNGSSSCVAPPSAAMAGPGSTTAFLHAPKAALPTASPFMLYYADHVLKVDISGDASTAPVPPISSRPRAATGPLQLTSAAAAPSPSSSATSRPVGGNGAAARLPSISQGGGGAVGGVLGSNEVAECISWLPALGVGTTQELSPRIAPGQSAPAASPRQRRVAEGHGVVINSDAPPHPQQQQKQGLSQVDNSHELRRAAMESAAQRRRHIAPRATVRLSAITRDEGRVRPLLYQQLQHRVQAQQAQVGLDMAALAMRERVSRYEYQTQHLRSVQALRDIKSDTATRKYQRRAQQALELREKERLDRESQQ